MKKYTQIRPIYWCDNCESYHKHYKNNIIGETYYRCIFNHTIMVSRKWSKIKFKLELIKGSKESNSPTWLKKSWNKKRVKEFLDNLKLRRIK